MVEIAGDIGGIRAIVNSLRGVAPEVNDSAEFLTSKVRQLTTDAGWSGHAAEAFRGAWSQDAVAMGELAGFADMTAHILDQLANGLYVFKVHANGREPDGSSSADQKDSADGRFVILNR